MIICYNIGIIVPYVNRITSDITDFCLFFKPVKLCKIVLQKLIFLGKVSKDLSKAQTVAIQAF